MGKLDNLIEDYRNVITNTLLSNETIISLLSNDTLDTESADELLWKRIVPQQYVPDTITDVGSYILYDIDENIISRQDKTYIELPIYFWVFTHRNSPTYKGKLCNDILVKEICFQRRNYSDLQMFILYQIVFSTILQMITQVDY